MNNNKKPKGVWITEAMLSDTGFTLQEKVLICYRQEIAKLKGFTNWNYSDDATAKMFGVSVSMVRNTWTLMRKCDIMPMDDNERALKLKKDKRSSNKDTASSNKDKQSSNKDDISSYKDEQSSYKDVDAPVLRGETESLNIVKHPLNISKQSLIISKQETPPTVSVRSNDKPKSDWFDEEFKHMEKQTETKKYDSEVIIKFAITKLNKECVSVYNNTKQNKNFVYYQQKNSNCWIGLNNTDYNEALELYKQGHQ
jgi:hypothetical protein